MKNELEMKADLIVQTAPVPENQQLRKLIYLSPSIEEHSCLIETGFAASVLYEPEDFGNGFYGGASSPSSTDDEPYNPWSDPTETLNTIDF